MSAVDGIDEFAAKLAGILKEKNAAYGDSFARVPTILAGMYQDVPPETLEGILFTARIQDKLGRIAKDPLGAGEDAYLDLAGYALLMANVQRLKREAAARKQMAQREALSKLAGKLAPDDGEDTALAAAMEPKAPRTGVMYLGDEAVHYDMPEGEPKAEAPSDGPVVVPATEWVIKREAEGGPLFLGTFDAGRPEWSPSEERAIRYLSRRAADFALAHHLPATTKGVAVESPKAEAPSEPNGRIKRDMANAEVTQEPTGWYIVCFEGRDRQFFNDFGGFWTYDIRDATSFLSQEAAESCLRKREGAPKAVCDETFEDAAARLTPALRESFKALLVALRKASSCE